MLRSLLNFGLLMCGIYPSILSLVYLLISLNLLMNFFKLNNKIYAFLLLYSSLSFVGKLIVVVIYYSDESLISQKDNEIILKVFGIYVDQTSRFDKYAQITLFPDLSVVFISVFMIKYHNTAEKWINHKLGCKNEIRTLGSENSSKVIDSPKALPSRCLAIMAYVYYILYSLYVWFIFSFIFLISLLTAINFLNFLRFGMILYTLCYLVFKMDKNLENSLIIVVKKWKILMSYTVSLIFLRYFYQFLGEISHINNEAVTKIGLKYYETNDYYKYMFYDCSILVSLIIFDYVYKNKDHFASNIASFDLKTLDPIESFIQLGKF